MADHAELAVRTEGSGHPVLVVHGWTMAGFVEALDFEPVFSIKPNTATPASTSTTGYRRIYIDLPGMGASAASGVTDLDTMLERMSSFVERHILPSSPSFMLVGTSCGGYLARALAHRFADSVDGLLLRVPVVEPETARRDVDAFVPDVRDDALLASVPEAEREAMGDVSVQTAEYVDALRRKAATAWRPAVATSDDDVLGPIRADPHRYRLTAPMHGPRDPFRKPVLIVTGRQDTDVGYRDAWPLLAHYPRATYVVLDRAGHGLPVDEGEKILFGALVRDWLRRVEEMRRLLVSNRDVAPRQGDKLP